MANAIFISSSFPASNPTLENIQYNSGYYAMMQFSHYIKQGFMIIHVNNENSLVAYDPATNTLVLVIVNPDLESYETNYDFRSFSNLGPITCTRTSSADEWHQEIEGLEMNPNSTLTYTAPPQSITTVVVQNAEFTENVENLLENGDFEDTLDTTSWILDPPSENILNGQSPFRGDLCGQVALYQIPNLSLSQTIIAPENGHYYVSAWATVLGVADNAHLQVWINGGIVNEVKIQPFGYRIYGLEFEAGKDDEIKIALAIQKGITGHNADAFIDDVSLYLGHLLDL